MIIGVVSADREAIIRLPLRTPDGVELEVDSIIDTGFNGWISLPPAVISQLGLPWRRRGRGLLADGSESIFDVYEATIVWDGTMRRVWVDEIDAVPMVGMALLDSHELMVQVWTDGNVTVAARD